MKISIIYTVDAALISSSIHTFTNSTDTHKYQRYTNMHRPCLDFPLWKLQYFGHLMRTANSGKEPDAGKDWRQKKRTTEDKVVGWHHWFSGHELGQTLGDGEGQRDLTCCSLWGHKKSDTTWQLNNNNKLHVSSAWAQKDLGVKRASLEIK